MRVLAVLAGLFFVVGTTQQAISPWGSVTLSNTNGVHDSNLHRWSAALAGGPDLGAAAVLFYIAWRPLSSPLVLQWLALAVPIFLAANIPFAGPAVALIAIPIVLVLVAYPRPRTLLDAPWNEGLSIPRLAVGGVIAVALLVEGAIAIAAQIHGGDELAVNYDWASNGEHLINVGLAALLAGMKKPGARALGFMAGAVVAFMGAAAITVPSNPGSWGMLGGVAGIAAGSILIAITAYDLRGKHVLTPS